MLLIQQGVLNLTIVYTKTSIETMHFIEKFWQKQQEVLELLLTNKKY